MNITRAAEKLFISQQSLSNHIIKLEKFVGTPLFSRNPTLSLTFAGSRFKIAAQKILDIKSNILTELEDISSNRRSKLSIGISHTRGRVFLPEILPSFMEQHPNTEISIIEKNSAHLEEYLSKGLIDLLIGCAPIMVDNVEKIEIFKERLFAVIPKRFISKVFPDDYEQAVNDLHAGFDINTFADVPFLLTSGENRLRNFFNSYASKHNVSPNILLESENSETLLALSCKGLGITVYPEMFVNHLSAFITFEPTSPVEFSPINEQDTIASFVIAYNREKYLSDAARDFIRAALQVHYGI